MKLILPLLLLSLTSCGMIVDRFSFYPDTATVVDDTHLPAGARRIAIRTDDGLAIEGLLFRHGPGACAKGLILYFHGNAGNMYHRIGEAEELFRTGRDVLVVSYRGYARSQGSPSEKGIYIDGRSALRHATHALGYDPASICVYGRSIGTTVAVEVARNKKIDRLILVTPLSSGYEFARARGFGALGLVAGRSFASIDKINDVRCPLLVIHGDRDEVVPYRHGLDLYHRYAGHKKMVTVKNGGHNDLEQVDPATYWNSIREFLGE